MPGLPAESPADLATSTRSSADAQAAPYDALLLVSFGGPEKPEDVIPFLENVTRGRGIPRERLAEVGAHYDLFGGRSPINDQCRAFKAAVEADFAASRLALPVYWGNRNWDPYLLDAVEQMRADGVRRAAAFVTSAYASYSGCRQYRENLYDAVTPAGVAGVRNVPPRIHTPRIDKLRHYGQHPGFVGAFVDAVCAALAELPAELQPQARLVFVTHSIPVVMAEQAGPDGRAYVAQHQTTARSIATLVGERTGVSRRHDLVYCSRSGPPSVPWLEPDVNDHLERLSAAGTEAVIVVPVGFVSDHMEVIYDLDTEARATAAALGLEMRRADTPGIHPAFVAVVRDLLLERAASERGEQPPRAVVPGARSTWDVCAADCCPNPRGNRPALAEIAR